MVFLRRLLINTLGLESYLGLVSHIYIYVTGKGFLKKKYPELFQLHKIIKPGFHCIDIGANLGYYSVKLSKIVGETGKVYAVEPVPLFYKIWSKNTKRFGSKNLELFPYALGEAECTITMGMPVVDGLAHHGMTKVVTGNGETYAASFDAKMVNRDVLFSGITKLDFVKCDIEGYENVAFRNMAATINRFKPLIQSELGGDENRKAVITQLESAGYTTCVLQNGLFVQASGTVKQLHSSDFYFLHEKHKTLIK